MKVAFRADASIDIGTGHIMRCLTLADALRERGADCRFVCRAHAGNLLDLIRQRGFVAHGLTLAGAITGPNNTNDEPPPVHAAWLGADWESDAEAALAVLGGTPVDWLIVDHYALDARWERCLRPACRRLMVIDDLADRTHDCDLLLDQNWFADETEGRYDLVVSPRTIKLLGPQYALLKPEYAQLRSLMPPRDGIVRRIAVFLGGSDPTNESAKVLQALMASDLAYLAVDLVIGVNHPDFAGIAKKTAIRPATVLHQNLPSLAGLMARADLMIGAGGSTTWERMSLGLPSIVISVAANQTPTNIALMKAGYINFIGEISKVTTLDIETAVRCACMAPHTLKTQSFLMQQLVPATGLTQVCENLLTYGLNNVTSSTH